LPQVRDAPNIVAMMTFRSILPAAVATLASCSIAQAQQLEIQTSQILKDQWFTGPLVAPSPALPQAGLFVIEPYAGLTFNTGKYLDNGGHQSGSDQARTASVFPLIEYAITDRLTIQTVPQVNYAWNGKTTTRGIIGSDLPVELKYRFVGHVQRWCEPPDRCLRQAGVLAGGPGQRCLVRARGRDAAMACAFGQPPAAHPPVGRIAGTAQQPDSTGPERL
jgi:hypothetical protein